MSDSVDIPRTLLLAGGGSGGHIYPNLAVVERLAEQGVGVTPHLLVSERAVDARVAEASGLSWSAVPAVPLRLRPSGLWSFVWHYPRGVKAVKRLIRETRPIGMIATGGFVSGPAVAAAKKCGLPVALMSLDAKPGLANRLAARGAGDVFSAYPTETLNNAKVIGYPLRASATADAWAAEAQAFFGLDEAKQTLLVFAGSQGARSINRAMMAIVSDEKYRGVLEGWQVLHLSGAGQSAGLAEAYEAAGVSAVVQEYCDRMDLAWAAAEAAVTRAGAGTVAEAWANAVPSVLLPYPYHKDEHQKHNAEPMVQTGGAVLLHDAVEPAVNAPRLAEQLGGLLQDESKRLGMSAALCNSPPLDGAEALAAWVRERLGEG